MTDRTCPVCGKTFEPTRGKRFCSRACWPSRRPFADPEAAPADGSPMTWDELTRLLWVAANRGSVQAMRILRREMKAEPGAESVIDQLARRRRPAKRNEEEE